MNRFILNIYLLFFLACTASAQSDVASAAKQINAIKMNKDYISSESTAETEKVAKENALALLEVNIEDWLISNQKNIDDVKGYIAKADNSVLEVNTRRGNRYRVFLYVKKSDIITFNNETEIVAASIKKDEQPTMPSSTVEELPVTIEVEVEQSGEQAYQPSPEEQKMLAVAKFDAVKPFITQNSGIRDYGKFADIPATGDCYLFVYNRNGEIAAYLKRGSEGYKNVKTGTKDSIDNYKGCGALWFRYNK